MSVARVRKTFPIVMLLLALCPMAASAQPMTMSFQGYLEDADGSFQGQVPMVFSIYDGPHTDTAAVRLWSETHAAVDVENGLYSVLLGGAGSPLDLPFDEPYFLGVTVGADAEMTPRQELTGVGSAANAERLAGQGADEFAPAAHDHDAAEIASGVLPEARIDSAIARLANLTFNNLTGIPAGLADGDDVGILAETDPLWAVSDAAGIDSADIDRWDVAHGWGDHSAAGYDTSSDAWVGLGDVYTTAGRVGIGTSAPDARLRVRRDGGVRTDMLHVTGNAGITGLYVDSWNRVGIRTTDMDREFNLDGTMVIDSSDSSNGILWQTPSTALIIGMIVSAADQSMGIGRNQPLKIEDLSPPSSVHIDSTGNVGIGEPNPTSALDVDGDASVSGYLQLGLTAGAPPASDCNEASERGRMLVDSAAGVLFVCVDAGWVTR